MRVPLPVCCCSNQSQVQLRLASTQDVELLGNGLRVSAVTTPNQPITYIYIWQLNCKNIVTRIRRKMFWVFLPVRITNCRQLSCSETSRVDT